MSAQPSAPDRRDALQLFIIGGGRVGRAVAKQFGRVTILEADEAKIAQIRAELPTVNVVAGDGRRPGDLERAGIGLADAVVVATESDELALLCATQVRRMRPATSVYARVDNRRNVARFRSRRIVPVMAPLATAASQLAYRIAPGRRHLVECVLTSGSPAASRPVSELKLGDKTDLISVLRTQKTLPPAPDLVLAPGDVLTLITLEERTLLLRRLTGRGVGFSSESVIHVPVQDATDAETTLMEAVALARRVHGRLVAIVPSKDDVLVQDVAQRIKADGARAAVLPAADSVWTTLRQTLAARRDTPTEASAKGGLVFDGVVVGREKLPHPLRRPWWRSRTEGILAQHPTVPVLVAANRGVYRSVLLVLDADPSAALRVDYALDVALTFGCRIEILVTSEVNEDPTGSGALAEYARRSARSYGLEVEVREIRGNPTLELVLEVRHGKHDLVVLSRTSQSVPAEFLRRILRRATNSALVVPAERA